MKTTWPVAVVDRRFDLGSYKFLTGKVWVFEFVISHTPL